MLALAVFLVAAQASSNPDAWSVERSYRYLNEEEGIDFTHVERIDYRFESSEARGFTISESRKLLATKFGKDTVPTAPDTTPQNRSLKFGAGGAPTYQEDTEDGVRARVDRMQWAAAEDRKGVSWTRRFSAVGAFPGAKLTMRPTGVTGENRTIGITYLEDGGEVKGEGTAIVTGPKRIVTSLKLTLTGVYPPGGDKQVKVAVNQSLIKQP